MKLNRRQVFVVGAGAAAIAAVGGRIPSALAATSEEIIKEFTGGAAPTAGKVNLKAPEIAENGNTVPVSVTVDSAMSGDDQVVAVLLLATGNPGPNVATFKFSEMSGKASASIRMRLAKTQDVMAIAKMKDGSLFQDTKLVKVTIGGCGG